MDSVTPQQINVACYLQIFSVCIELTYLGIMYLMYPDAMMWYEEYKGETKPDATPQPAWTTNSSANADTATSTPTNNTIT